MKSGLDLAFISKRRQELHLKQSDMALLLGMGGAPDYSKYENGVYKLNAEKIPLLAAVLKCRIESLFITYPKREAEEEIKAEAAPDILSEFERMTFQLMQVAASMDIADIKPDLISEIRKNVYALGCFSKVRGNENGY